MHTRKLVCSTSYDQLNVQYRSSSSKIACRLVNVYTIRQRVHKVGLNAWLGDALHS